MTALLRPDETLTLGVNVIVRPGDPTHSVACTCGLEGNTRSQHRYFCASRQFVAPQDWVALTGPCPTCSGTGQVCAHVHGTMRVDHVVDCGTRKQCENPDCRDGRRIVPLYRADPAYYSPPNFNRVLVGRGSIQVVPVSPWASHVDTPKGRWLTVTANGYLTWQSCDGYTLTTEPAFAGPLDPLPVPGRDWGIVIDCVELA